MSDHNNSGQPSSSTESENSMRKIDATPMGPRDDIDMQRQRRIIAAHKAALAQSQLNEWAYEAESSHENQCIMVKALVAEAARQDLKRVGGFHDEEGSVMWYRRWFHVMHGVSSDIAMRCDPEAIRIKLSKISMFQPSDSDLVVDYFSEHGSIATLRARQDEVLRELCRDGTLFHAPRERAAAQ